MSRWLEIIKVRGQSLREVRAFDQRNHPDEGLTDVTDEEVVAQVIYEAISEFIERDDFRLLREGLGWDDRDLDRELDQWIDAQAP